MRHLSAQILALDRREVGGRRGEQRTKPLHPIEITREAVRHRHRHRAEQRSEEQTSELQSLIRISYAVFCLKKKNIKLSTINVDGLPTAVYKTTPTESDEIIIINIDD